MMSCILGYMSVERVGALPAKTLKIHHASKKLPRRRHFSPAPFKPPQVAIEILRSQAAEARSDEALQHFMSLVHRVDVMRYRRAGPAPSFDEREILQSRHACNALVLDAAIGAENGATPDQREHRPTHGGLHPDGDVLHAGASAAIGKCQEWSPPTLATVTHLDTSKRSEGTVNSLMLS